MTKKILLAAAILFSIFGIYYTRDTLASLVGFFMAHPTITIIVGLAVIIQLVGHLLRAKRTKLVLDQAAKSSLQFQFAALSTGYLFNALLPLRLGELVRALLVARRLHISLLYTFSAIIIERATDVIFLSIIIIIGALAIGGTFTWELVMIAAVAAAVATSLLYGFFLLKNENVQLLRAVAWLSKLFNAGINNRLRFKVWSLIFGLQSFAKNRTLAWQYIGYAGLSWFCYFTSALLIATSILSIDGLLQAIIASVSPYLVSLSPHDTASYQHFNSLLSTHLGSQDLPLYATLLWAVLVLPMAIIGLVGLCFYRQGTRQTADKIKENPYINKLLRHRDISQDFPAFLDSYFSGNSLARILHKIEVSGQLSLVRFFKGGSDAITILVLQDGELYVKKIIPLKYRDRLKAQYDWLKKHKKMHYLVNVIGEQDTDEYYAIDLAYDPNNIPFFEYAHHSSFAESKHVIEKVWKALYEHLHTQSAKPTYDPKARDAYIKKHIFGCVERAAAANDDIRLIISQPTILINGSEYDNLYQIMDKIKKNKHAWRDIATYSHSRAVHGDPSIDNILVSPKTGKPLIIDPAPDGNIIEGPVFDLGKFSQSFYCGYEFSFRDESEVELEGKNIVRYRDHVSTRYQQLWRYVHGELAPQYVSEAEQKSMIFHAAALHLRRLKHQAYYNPGNTLKFYAVGVKALNEFLDQYENK